MRPIKFRAWDEKERVMFEISSLQWCIGGLQVEDGDPIRFVGDQLEIMQFTGLLDKNGKEIYEGDIVQFQNRWMPQPEFLGRILWCSIRLCYSVSEDTSQYNLGAALLESMDNGICEGKLLEVIGNIYENPELLRRG